MTAEGKLGANKAETKDQALQRRTGLILLWKDEEKRRPGRKKIKLSESAGNNKTKKSIAGKKCSQYNLHWSWSCCSSTPTGPNFFLNHWTAMKIRLSLTKPLTLSRALTTFCKHKTSCSNQ
jgi:hypothetical protein